MSTEAPATERLSLLQGVPMLAGLSARQLEKMAGRGQERTYPAGDTIVRQGEKSSGLFLVVEGSAEVRRAGRRVRALTPGQFFGEAALLVDEPRTADVVATSTVRCLVLDRWEFWDAVGIDPQVDRALYDATVERLRAFRGELVE